VHGTWKRGIKATHIVDIDHVRAARPRGLRMTTPTPTLTGPGYTIVEDASLEGRNTFRVPARAQMLIDIQRPAALAEVLAFPYLKTQPLLVLGGGSNMLFTRDWPGVVLSMAAHGTRIIEERGDAALVRAEAGESWNDLVTWSLGRGFVGLENLVLIPGSVGAAPIQNIGAYGREVREFVSAVDSWDRHANAIVRMDSAACAFAYRDSIFKHDPDRYIISAVEFLLPRSGELRMDYAGIADEIAAMNVEANPRTVAEAVARLRTRKLPNPAIVGNAGSFFKNPVVTDSVAGDLKREHPAMPSWPAGDGHRKLSAAWLLEAAGLKGAREGDAVVSNQHALVLVNEGRATGAQVWTLAQRVQETVSQRFDVRLEPEPIVI
jgi:UDP-N-acetylmuramate dehydrogenase